ncbi:MAG: FAD-dependent monooxygenase, partial [Cyanobacteria bacterium REEB65]|nr:FAD-dependent monooxygenase [Cyanobacteria bacterium REEB65]
HSDEPVMRFFTEQFPDAVPLMPTLLDDFRHNPTSSLVYVRCWPWHMGDKVALVGDACHAVVPFYGQGMNAAFEDCSVLAECLDLHGSNVAAAFADYEQRRKIHTDALADLAVANFVEMRSKVADWRFHVKNRADKLLHRLFPRRWIPLYSMVTFSRMPYAETVAKARRQDRYLTGMGIGLGILLAAALGRGWIAMLRISGRFN